MARPRRPELHPRLAEFRQRAGLTQDQVAEHVGISAEMVRRHERGDHMPIELYRKRYCQLFAATESDLGFRPPSQAGAMESRPSPIVPVTFTEFGDADYLAGVHNHIHEIVALDNRFGGADLVRLSSRFFRSLRDQLGAGAYDPRLERDLYAAAGELAEVAGWLAYDAEEHDLTRRMNQESLYFTRLAGDRVTELLTIQNASMHAASQGRPKEALQLARSVLEGDNHLSPRLRSLFLTRKARALAQCGDESALKLFPEINSLFLDGVSSTDPTWAWWVDKRELLWHEAMAQRDLGQAQAVTHFEESAHAVPSDETRSQYVHGSHLFQAQVENRSWDAAEQTLMTLIPLSGQVASTRATVLLRGVIDHMNTAAPSSIHEQASRFRAVLDSSAI